MRRRRFRKETSSTLYTRDMCGRYVAPEEAAIEREFHVQRRSWPARLEDAAPFGASYNVAPSQQVPVLRVIRGSADEREGLLMRWGLIPYWANGQPPKFSTINCRIETMETSSSFRDAWQRGQRCIFPAASKHDSSAVTRICSSWS